MPRTHIPDGVLSMENPTNARRGSKPIVCNGLREIKVYDSSEHTTAKHNVSIETEEIEPKT